MDWISTKDRLLLAAKKIKENNVVDTAVEALLDEIPFIGSFASTYWSKVGGDDPTKAVEIAAFLERISEQEVFFKNTQTLLEQHGDMLLESQRSLDLIVVGIQNVGASIQPLTDEVKALSQQVAQILDVTNSALVADALKVSTTLIDDHQRRNALIQIVTRAIESTGQPVNKETLYDLGILCVAISQSELAEACLLEVHHRDPELRKALSGLSTLYQRRAHEYILQKNYGFADEVLEKAQAYAKAARDDLDIEADLQAAYNYEERAQTYKSLGQRPQMAEALTAAKRLFSGVLAVDRTNVSALIDSRII